MADILDQLLGRVALWYSIRWRDTLIKWRAHTVSRNDRHSIWFRKSVSNPGYVGLEMVCLNRKKNKLR